MATHSSILAWRIPRTEDPGQLQSTVLQRVGQHNRTHRHTHAKDGMRMRLPFIYTLTSLN